MPKMIYLVQGNEGEYSDYREWVICAYSDEGKARDHALKAKQWVQQNITWTMGWDERDKLKNPFDGSYYGNHPDTDWTAYGVEVRQSLPTVDKPMPVETT